MRSHPKNDLQNLRMQASNIYFELIARLGDEKTVAQRIAPLFKSKIGVVKRFLNRFSFRNKKSTEKFIRIGNRVLKELDEHEINARALLVCDNKQSPVEIKEKVKHFLGLGIWIAAPQLLVDVQDAQFWNFVQQDAKYVDFIIAPSCLTEIKNNEICKIAAMYDIEVMDEHMDNEIKVHALQISIARSNKRC